MPKILKRTEFGDTILRAKARRLSEDEILSEEIQQLIENIRYTVEKKKYGVGMAAPQVGASVAVSVIAIKPTPTRPDVKPFDSVIINPEVIEVFGKPLLMWEACLSFGTPTSYPYAQAVRHDKIRVKYLDEYAKKQEEIVEGFVAQVFQHETDHLNGVLFVDRVKDSKSFITLREYKKLKKNGLA